MENIQFLFWTVVAFSTSVDAQGFSPTQGFYVITNQPSRGPNSGNLYLYAITTSRLTSGDEVEFTKSEYGLPRSLVKTGVIPATSDYIWGCFLKVGQPNRYKGIRYGTYTVTSADKSGTRSINTFVRPKTKILNPEGTFSVTVYPKAIGSTDLAPSDYNPIGVAWTPGCQNIRWCKGKRRNINTGPRLTLTSTEDAGIYTIQRRSRKRKGQFVQIEVIVASCPQGLYLSGGACLVRSNYPCENGGVEKDDRDVCICPPFFATNDCSEHIDVPEEPYGLTFADASRNLFCGNLNGGNTKCKGFLFCPGELFGCKCFPGWFGNNCDIGCPKGKWGIACSLTCPAGNKQCNRFDGSNTPE